MDTERRHSDPVSRGHLLLAVPLGLTSVQKAASLKNILFLGSPTPGVPLMHGVEVRCRALCGPEFYFALATALILSVVLSVLASRFTPTGADLFCTPTLPWCGLPENPICDTFIRLGLTRFLKCLMQKYNLIHFISNYFSLQLNESVFWLINKSIISFINPNQFIQYDHLINSAKIAKKNGQTREFLNMKIY